MKVTDDAPFQIDVVLQCATAILAVSPISALGVIARPTRPWHTNTLRMVTGVDRSNLWLRDTVGTFRVAETR